MRGRVVLGRLIVTAGVILLAACGRSDFPTTPPVAQGTAVTDGGLEMTVTDTLLDAVTGGYGYSWGIYVVVKVHVSNAAGNKHSSPRCFRNCSSTVACTKQTRLPRKASTMRSGCGDGYHSDGE
jgi:hypothetical protein